MQLNAAEILSHDFHSAMTTADKLFKPLNAELNPICHLLALLRAHHILHVSRIRVKVLWLLYDP
jgi:hypothetical protein